MINKILFVLLILAPFTLQAQFSRTLKFDHINNVDDGYWMFDHGNKVATGSDAVAERLTHEVFVGVGHPPIRTIGPHPIVANEPDEWRKPEMEVFSIRALDKPKDAYAIKHSQSGLYFTSTLSGDIALKKFERGNENQQFKLTNAPDAGYSTSLAFLSGKNGLVVTKDGGKLALKAPGEEMKGSQLWYSNSEKFYDFVYETNGPDGILAFNIGDQIRSLSNHEKARSYYEKAYEMAPDNYRVLELLGDRYQDYDEKKSVKFYEEAFNLGKDNAEFCARMGLKALLVHVPNGLKYCRRANELEPGSVDFRDLAWFNNGMAPVKYKDKYGVINLKGELLTKEWYDDTYQDFDNIMIPVKKDGKWRNLNNRGEFVGDWIKSGGSFKNGIVTIQCSEDKWGVMDTTGHKILPCQYKDADIVNDMIMVQNQQDQYKVFSRTGEPLTDEWYEGGWASTYNIMIALQKDGKWRILNPKGEFLKGEYKSMTVFTEGVAFVKNDKDKWGAIDTTGQLVIPYKYHDANVNINGMAAVKNKKDEYAIINTEGKMLSDDWYNKAWVKFSSPMIALQKKNLLGKRWFYVNKNGEQVFRKCRDIARFSEGYAFVKRWGNWGVINENGEKMTDFEYDAVKSNFENGRAIVELDGENFYINPRGERVQAKLLEP